MRTATEERRIVTVLFADLVGFTSLSENRDPEAVKHLVDGAFERLVADVVAFGGRVDKIVGDAIVALFGAPRAHEDDAERAVRAALRMQSTLQSFAEEAEAEIRMRVGVNTGEVLVGALRAGGDYTAMGDVVNTAARLQSHADPGSILVGETTHGATEAVVQYENRGNLYVRGREAPVKAFEPVAVLSPPGIRPWIARVPMVGRSAEMALLRAAADTSIGQQRAQFVLLAGDAGVGKSRVASEFATSLAETHGARVFAGRCVPYGESNTWWPLAEILRDGCGVVEDEPVEMARSKVMEWAQRLLDPAVDGGDPDRVVNGILHVMGFDSPLRGLDPARSRAEATDAMVAFMVASVRQGPIVIRLADLHWADESVLSIIDDLLGRVARQPYVFVATARRSLMRRWSPRFGRFNSMIVNLDPLGADRAAQLLDEMLVGREMSDEMRNEVLDRAGGNPLFLGELVRFVEKSGVDSSELLDIPNTLVGLVSARIDALTVEELDVVDNAAVWGPSGSLRVLEMLGERGRPAVDLPAVVRSLVEKEVLTLEGTEWAFRSDVLREVAYNRLTKADRLRRHAGIAKHLDATMSGRFIDDGLVDILGRHYFEAAVLARGLHTTEPDGDLDERAIVWLREGARRAERAANWSLAIKRYTEVLELTDATDPAGQVTALLSRSVALMESWDFERSKADLQHAGRVATAHDDPMGRAWTKLLGADLERRRGQLDRANKQGSVALAEFEALEDQRGTAMAQRLLGAIALVRGDGEAAERYLHAARDGFDALSDRSGVAWVVQHLAWLAFLEGRHEDALLRIDEAVEAFAEMGDRLGQLWSEGLRAFVAADWGARDAARDAAESVLAEAEALRDPWGEGMMSAALAIVAMREGAVGDAVDGFERSTKLLERLGAPIGLSQVTTGLGVCLIYNGQVKPGLEVLDRAEKRATDGGSNVAAARAGVSAMLGEVPSARVRRQMRSAAAARTVVLGDEFQRVIAAVLVSLMAGEFEQVREWWGGNRPPGDAPMLVAANALIQAWGPSRTASAQLVDAVLSDHRTSFQGRFTALLASYVVESRLGSSATAEKAARALTDHVDHSEDRLARAIVAKLWAHLDAQHGGAESPSRPAAAALWSELGVRGAGWDEFFARCVPVEVVSSDPE